MRATIPKLRCPLCKSSAITYTCEPKCCYNHVCDDCNATFELETRYLGSELRDVEPPERLLDSCDPTAECARCHAIGVYQVDGQYTCLACSALLSLEYTEIAP